jgi:hypothetical protein
MARIPGTAHSAPIRLFRLPDLRRRRTHRRHVLIREFQPILALRTNQNVLFQVV